MIASNSCGYSAARSITISKNNPSVPGALSGNLNGLCGVTNGAYSVPIVAGITYNWIVPVGVTITGGQGTNAITASFPSSSAISGYIAVTANNACGASGQRRKVAKTSPAVPATINGSSSVCPNSTGNAYSITAVVSAVTYTWTAPSGSLVSDGVTTSANNIFTTASTSVTVNYGAVTATSKLSVKANNLCGSSTSKAITLTPLTCRDGELTGAINTTAISIYPNPAHDFMTLSINARNATEFMISLIDMTGKIIFVDTKKATEGVNKFDYGLSHFAKGFYILKVQSADEIKFSRLDIQ